jgi:hypothetical protein
MSDKFIDAKTYQGGLPTQLSSVESGVKGQESVPKPSMTMGELMVKIDKAFDLECENYKGPGYEPNHTSFMSGFMAGIEFASENASRLPLMVSDESERESELLGHIEDLELQVCRQKTRIDKLETERNDWLTRLDQAGVKYDPDYLSSANYVIDAVVIALARQSDLRDENARLREALEKIAAPVPDDMVPDPHDEEEAEKWMAISRSRREVARNALEGGAG